MLLQISLALHTKCKHKLENRKEQFLSIKTFYQICKILFFFRSRTNPGGNQQMGPNIQSCIHALNTCAAPRQHLLLLLFSKFSLNHNNQTFPSLVYANAGGLNELRKNGFVFVFVCLCLCVCVCLCLCGRKDGPFVS